jgi:hypothetical protein
MVAAMVAGMVADTLPIMAADTAVDTQIAAGHLVRLAP